MVKGIEVSHGGCPGAAGLLGLLGKLGNGRPQTADCRPQTAVQ